MVQPVSKIWMDGKMVDWADANVHIMTHSLHYGMAPFEGIRCYKGEKGSAVFRLKEHVDRLFDSCHICQMEVPFSREEISQAILDTVRVNNLEECYIRPLIYIGEGAMGLLNRGNPIRVAIAAWTWGAYLGEEGLAKGIRIKTSSFTRHHVNISMTRGKVSGYYVNSQLAKREVVTAGYDEALLLDPEGYVAEGSGENIFIVRKGVLKTTPLTCVLDGITRDSIMQLAREKGLKVVEERFTRDEVYIAQEAFFTGTAAEITPIRELDDRLIGAGEPGPVTKQLQAAFFDIVRGKDTSHAGWLTYL
ncbi:MAG: branched-chain amino acid transaminase [Nitrospirota bacterium]|nr:branched-chain amino acid transaminase [Nitrospirota bacterium]